MRSFKGQLNFICSLPGGRENQALSFNGGSAKF
jgi:hypothetical protein